MAYKRYAPRRFRKRWYVDARIGKGVPIIGGTGIVAGSGRRGFQKRGLNALIKRQALKSEETKEMIRVVGSSTFNHSTVYNTKLNALDQGTSQQQRVGDKVFYCGINMKFLVMPAVANSTWRIYVVKARQSSSTTNHTSFDGSSPAIGGSLMFRNGDTNPYSLLNTDDVTVLCSKTLKVDQKFSGETNISRIFKMNCKIMKNFQYQTGTTINSVWTPSQDGEYFNYYLVVVPFSHVAGATTSTNVGQLYVTVEQVFKDA